MKKTIICFLFMGIFVVSVCASYYKITTDIYTPGLTLQTGDTLYMTNGGFGSLTLLGNSLAFIKGTSLLEQGFGGIWYLSLAENSHLDISGGQVNQLAINNDATAILRGGRIDHIYSYQWVPTSGRDGEPIPYIKLYYSGDEPEWDPITNILTGTWEDGSSFTIQLHDVPSYSPAISNIDLILIPEPTTVLLLGIGGLLIRRKK